MKLKYKLFLLVFSFALAGIQFAVTQPASAALSKEKQRECFQKYDGFRTTDNNDKAKQYSNSDCPQSKGGNCKATPGSSGALISCTDPDKKDSNDDSSTTSIGADYDKNDCKGKYERLDENNCEVLSMITLITNVLAGLAGVVIVAMIIVGGIQYSMAGADPSKVQAARHKISNALLALLLLVFGFAIIQWLVPGGLF